MENIFISVFEGTMFHLKKKQHQSQNNNKSHLKENKKI